MIKTFQKLDPDIVLKANNEVVAAYILGPDIIIRESRLLWGVPFIFYTGTTRDDAVYSLRKDGIDY